MNWQQLLKWLWDHYQELIAAGHQLYDFYLWAANAIETLINGTPNGKIEEVTDEMMQKLAESWAGPLPPFPEE